MKTRINSLPAPASRTLRAGFSLLGSLAALTAITAADTHSPRSDKLNPTAAPIKASELIGQKIENNAGQKVGSVDDLAIDLQGGRVVHVIVESGGFLSMGERHTPVPPGQVHLRAQGKPLHLDVTRESLKAAPALAMSDWKDYYQSDRVRDSYRHYGEQAAFEGTALSATAPAFVTSPNGLGHVQRATKIMGLAVQNLQDEKIGTVDNLIIDLPAGRVVAVIVSSGGFLGLGDTLSVIPPTVLRYSAEHDRLRLDTTKEALRDAPRFKAGEWPDFAQRDYTAGVYRAYRQEPYVGRDADNAARNRRDRDGRTLTPADQGGNAGDVALTQEIRKAVVAADGLSVNAQNVKIITVNGRVTLRGPVRTAEEKSAIVALASRFAGADRVDDQLEVTAR